jgi:tetraacyldisaccharide 4'-kinase
MNNKIYFWVESYLFNPNLLQKLISLLLLPLTFIYCIVIYTKNLFIKKINFPIPIISIGNLIVGGSGKTPITIALAKDKKDIAIILRGYGRESLGLKVVSYKGEILTHIKESGDEAMLLAKSLKNATIIVSENRIKAIEKALFLGSKIIYLDDGYSKKMIKKFDILIKPNLKNINNFCLPSGPYRESYFEYKKSNMILEEDIDFKREVKILNKTSNMVLITAISKPQRLNKFVDVHIPKVYFPDHYSFTKKELEEIVKKYSATSILTTTKDMVKMEEFNLNLSILDLSIIINKKKILEIDSFLEDFDKIS